MADADPFTGKWIFKPQQSELNTKGPRSWVQEIFSSADKLSVYEEIEGWDGQRARVTVDAVPDGRDYPVFGSAVMDAIAYKRLEVSLISGHGRRRGVTSFEAKLEVRPRGSVLAVTFIHFRGRKEVATGTAVFEKARQTVSARLPGAPKLLLD